jgi:hypothetical protein
MEWHYVAKMGEDEVYWIDINRSLRLAIRRELENQAANWEGGIILNKVTIFAIEHVGSADKNVDLIKADHIMFTQKFLEDAVEGLDEALLGKMEMEQNDPGNTSQPDE